MPLWQLVPRVIRGRSRVFRIGRRFISMLALGAWVTVTIVL